MDDDQKKQRGELHKRTTEIVHALEETGRFQRSSRHFLRVGEVGLAMEATIRFLRENQELWDTLNEEDVSLLKSWEAILVSEGHL